MYFVALIAGTKMTKWIKFIGSDEQIAEIENGSRTRTGVLLKLNDGTELLVFHPFCVDDDSKLRGELAEYLICEPIAHCDMIIEWAKTGRPVYLVTEEGGRILCPNPAWYEGTRYSFSDI